MNIYYRTASIFTINAEAYVNPVNCLGVSGAGLALKFKTAFPENFSAYQDWCFEGLAEPGKIFVFETKKERPKYIVNLTTKADWKNRSHPEWIRDGLLDTMMWMSSYNIKSIAIPLLGCGLGGLDWQKEIEPIYKATFATFSSLDCDVTVLV